MTDLATDWYGGHIATFGDRLAAARDAAQLSQQQLSKHLGVRLKTLKSWENDSSEPRSNKLSMIAGVLNVSLIWLLTGEGEGVLAPDDMPQPAPELAQVMSDIKDLKEILVGSVERLEQLEKRLPTVLGTPR